MHKIFRKRLDAAKGYSEQVIAVNADIRGFSDWSLSVDSAQTAQYVKRFYARTMDDFFPDAAFVKATGDGLLIVLGFEEDEVVAAVRTAVKQSLSLVAAFPTLTAGDPNLNFPTPEHLGVGLSRGPASRLSTGRTTLDYSGRVLNLASRLMDVARPKGVVFDDQLGFDLLTPSMRARFDQASIYLKGIAPREPLSVRFTKEETRIGVSHLRPLDEPEWDTFEQTFTLKEMEGSSTGGFHFALDNHPSDVADLTVAARHDKVGPGGRRSPDYWTRHPLTEGKDFRFEMIAGRPFVIVIMPTVATRLRKGGVRGSWPVKIEISYPKA